jgi:hypothetical protein
MMYQDAKLKGIRFPLYEDCEEGLEVAQVVYAGPGEALKFITSAPFVSGLADYLQSDEPCILEILLGVVSADNLRELTVYKRELIRRAANRANGAMYG